MRFWAHFREIRGMELNFLNVIVMIEKTLFQEIYLYKTEKESTQQRFTQIC